MKKVEVSLIFFFKSNIITIKIFIQQLKNRKESIDIRNPSLSCKVNYFVQTKPGVSFDFEPRECEDS